MTAPTTAAPDLAHGTARSSARGALAACLVLYLVVALAYSLRTPAWEANDELDHVNYSQQLQSQASLPVVGPGWGIESGQPPLYYAALVVWQRALRIPVFVPSARPAEDQTGYVRNYLSHDYTPEERRQATWLHLLRLFSVACGAVTVTATFLLARRLTRRTATACAAALFVALLPKFDVVSATVQNDALATALCTVALLLVVRWRQEPASRSTASVLGLVAGGALLTKYTTLPLVGLLGLYVVAVAVRERQRVDDVLTMAAVVAGTSGWWFLHDVQTYGDPLSTTANNAYLAGALPGLVEPVGWLSHERFLDLLPRTFFPSVWYGGGWNQFRLPLAWGVVASLLAAALTVSGIVLFLRRRPALPLGWPSLPSAVLAAVAALLLIAKNTTQAEGRYVFVGLGAFAVVLAGSVRLVLGRSSDAPAGRLLLLGWPLALLTLQGWVVTHVLLPYGGW